MVACTLLLATTGCVRGVIVQTAYDRNVEFENYRSFAMMLPNKPVQTRSDLDPFVMQRLRQLAYLSLSAKGLEPVEKKRADLLVSVVAGSDERVEVFRRSFYYGYYYPPFYGGPTWSYDVRQYEEAVVVIDLIDPETNAVVWRGQGNRRLRGGLSDEELQQVVQGILSHFPPAGEEPS